MHPSMELRPRETKREKLMSVSSLWRLQERIFLSSKRYLEVSVNCYFFGAMCSGAMPG